MKKHGFPSLVCAVALLSAACAKRPVPLGPLPKPSVVSDSMDRARADSIARAEAQRRADAARAQAEQDSLRAAREREQAQASRETTPASDAMATLSQTVYFDYDQSTLTDAARAILNAKVPVLQTHPTMHIRITGNTDSRGSAEYNLALGLRRASETKAYLVANGIDAERIEIFSFGAEHPAVDGSGEDAWSKNRRAEFAPLQ